MGPESRRSKIFDWHLAALEIHVYRDLDKIIWNQSGEFPVFSSLFVAVKLLSHRPSSPALVIVLAGFRPGLEIRVPAQDSARNDAAYIFWLVSAKKLDTKGGIEPGCHYVKGPCQAWNLWEKFVRRVIEYELV